MSLKGKLFIVSAPSGAGKTTLCDMLIQDFSDVKLSISATTRPKRPYEVDGVHYHFLTPEEFQRRIDKKDFVEWAEVHGNRYGTLKTTIDQALAKGHSLLFDIDVQGAMSLKKLFPEQCVLIFILPPSMETLQTRLEGRKGESGGAIETRLQNAYNELEWSQKFDYQIVNDQLERAYGQMKEIVKASCRPVHKKMKS